MKILALECSATAASAAVIEDGRILGSSFVSVKLTHSQTLLPMTDALLKSCHSSVGEIDGFCISAGPGSFTGVRIGISAIKGLAAAKKRPCVGVSTLAAVAENFHVTDCTVCAVMDARCNQVYNALFTVSNGEITRLCDDRAVPCEELAGELEKIAAERIIIAGDGADVFFPFVKDIPAVEMADEQHRYQTAVGVGLAALPDFEGGNTLSPEELLPVYLRLPQAERELKMKTKSGGQ